MSKRFCVTVAVIVLAFIGVLAVWMLTRGEPGAPAEAPAVAEPEPVEEPAAKALAEVPLETPEAPEPVEEVTVDVDEEVAAAIPETDDAGGSLVRMPESLEPEILDERCAEIIAEMEKRQGKDKIRTMQCSAEMILGELGTMTSNMTFVPPMKMFNEMTMKMGETTMRQYVVTDGVFMEVGMIGTDGARKAMTFGDYDPAQAGMNLGFGGPGAKYTEAVDIKADPADAIFQKADGAPLDNLDLVMLRGEQGDMPFELFVDTTNYQFVAMRVYSGGAPVMELSQVGYAEIAEGIFYPVSYNIHMDAAAMGRGGPPQLDMQMTMKDFRLNEPVDESTFHFSSKVE